VSYPPVVTQNTREPTPLTMAPATVRSDCAKPSFGYTTLGVYDVTNATRSSVWIAPRLVLFTYARCGRPLAGFVAIACAAARSCRAADPRFGLAYVYEPAFAIAGTPLSADSSACGVSAVVCHAASASSGRGSVSR
jgi:hypothetical protein